MSDRLDLALELMDKQLLDSAGTPCGKVEDLEFSDEDAGPVVVAILTTWGALGQRLHGRMGRLIYAAWRRLRPQARPSPTRIEWEHVEKVDYAVHLDVEWEEAGLELSEVWFRDHFISRIPGAGGEETAG